MSAARSFLRPKNPHGHHRVTYVELFFDLVFVFAITQISHTLLAHFTPLGILQVLILFFAVWWVWIFTSWITNWLDPERTPIRLMLFAMMIAGLVLSASIPKAFESRGLVFALAFVAMQVGRTVYSALAVPASERSMRMNLWRISIWLAFSGVFWIAGGLAEDALRPVLWSVALAIEYAGPAMRFRCPGLGASSFQDWDVEGGHMAERCALFIIIALGESIVVTGATFSGIAWSGETVAAFIVSLIGSIAMWWVYFHLGVEAGAKQIVSSDESGKFARVAYTYLHLPIVLGIVVSAVGDEILLAHPQGHMDTKAALSIIGGPMLFLLGTLLFKHVIRGIYQLSHLVGMGLLLLLFPVAPYLTPLTLAAAAASVLIIVGAWEAASLGGPDRAET